MRQVLLVDAVAAPLVTATALSVALRCERPRMHGTGPWLSGRLHILRWPEPGQPAVAARPDPLAQDALPPRGAER